MCIQMKIFLWLLVGLLIATQASLGQEAQKPTGTGFVVDANGYLLTCEHVVRDTVKVEVAIGEKTYEAAVLTTDEKRDLALLEIKAKGLPILPVGNSNKVEVGEEVRAFGFPLASVLGTSVKVTRGTISGIETMEAQKVFQIDASVNPGNSGGPLVNERGEVIGIINAKLVGMVVSKVGFAVPINYAKQMLRDEGVEFASEGAKANLDGPALVKQVSPAIALITITSKAIRNPKDGAEMVYIPPGEFIMGTSDEQIDSLLRQFPTLGLLLLDNDKPQHRVYLDGYWIYKYEVTVAQYRKFCNETGRQMPTAPPWGWQNDHPIVNVTWYDAVAYCEWSGVQLPMEAQWEKAARGTDGRIWPWENQWDSSKCNSCESGIKRTTPIGSYPQGTSPYGLMDMAGNVYEWCADWYDKNYYVSAPDRNPQGPSAGIWRVLRGGSWLVISIYVRVANREGSSPDRGCSNWGFRCVALRLPH